MKSNSLLLTCDVLFRFIPFFLDTAIQIWNAVEIDRLTTSCDARVWDYETQQQVKNVTSKCGIWKKNPISFYFNNFILTVGCFLYQTPICCSASLPPPLTESIRKKRAVSNDIYEKEFSFSIKISTEGLMSLIFVQLPGICLGLLGILKAFINHGPSKEAVVDSLRYT